MNWVADLRSGLESEIGRKYLEREKAWFMDRRHFCLQIAAAAGLLSESGRIVQACNTAHDDTLAATADVYALWSVLIPVIQIQPGKGYMIADETAIPDGLPRAGTGEKETPLAKAIRLSKQTGYEITVPFQDMPAFSEALAEATLHRRERVRLERRFRLPKRYRLLAQTEVRAYFDLSPASTVLGWRPDPKTARFYKGWNEISSISPPFFSRSRDFAMIWASTHSGCSEAGWFFFKRTEEGWKRVNWATQVVSFCA